MEKKLKVPVYLFSVYVTCDESADISFEVDVTANEEFLKELDAVSKGFASIQISKRESARVLRQFLKEFLRRKGII